MRCLFKTLYWLLLAAAIIVAALGSLYLRRSNSLHDLIVTKAERHRIDPRLALALVHASSHCQPSWSEGDRFGLLALSKSDLTNAPAVAGRVAEVFDLFDPETNLELGFAKFARMREAWHRQQEPEAWALAEWFAGPEKTRNWAATTREKSGATDGIADQRLRAQIDGILSRIRPCSLSLSWPGRAGDAR
jgi:hypothetical protein